MTAKMRPSLVGGTQTHSACPKWPNGLPASRTFYELQKWYESRRPRVYGGRTPLALSPLGIVPALSMTSGPKNVDFWGDVQYRGGGLRLTTKLP